MKNPKNTSKPKKIKLDAKSKAWLSRGDTGTIKVVRQAKVFNIIATTTS